MTEQWGQADSMLVEQWTRIRAQLRAEVGDAAFNSWLKPLTLGEMLGSRLRIAVPTRFMRDWIEDNYGPRLTEFWQEENTNVSQVEIIVEPIRTAVPDSSPARPRRASAGGALRMRVSRRASARWLCPNTTMGAFTSPRIRPAASTICSLGSTLSR